MGPSSRKKQLSAALFALGIAVVANPGTAAAEDAESDTSTRSGRSSAGSPGTAGAATSAAHQGTPGPMRRPTRNPADAARSGSESLPTQSTAKTKGSPRDRRPVTDFELRKSIDSGSKSQTPPDDNDTGPGSVAKSASAVPAADVAARQFTAVPSVADLDLPSADKSVPRAELLTQAEGRPPAPPVAANAPIAVAEAGAIESAATLLFGSQPGAPVQSPLSWVVLAAARRQGRVNQSRPTAVPVGSGLVLDSSTTPPQGFAAPGSAAGVAPAATIGSTATADLSPADRAFWTEQRGVGFSVGSLGALGDQDRLEGALAQTAAQGFNAIRTWGTDAYTGRILEAITRLDLPIKVQPGIYITRDADARAQIDSALDIINPYADKVIGVSLGNEQIVDWNASATLTVPEVIDQVAYFKNQSDIPVTYNFAGETFLPGASQWDQNLAGLVDQLDYINVHSYAGFFDNRNNPAWTPERQLDSLKSYETLLSTTLDSLGLGDKPIILGETGWQSTGYNPAVTNPENMQEYYEGVTRYVYGSDARFDGMFYFNLTDEAWKGGDDNWGLFSEGSRAEIGAPKFAVTSIGNILGDTASSALQTVKSNGPVTLLTDPATGIAFIQNGTDPAIEITRADSYWNGEVPLSRGGATLVSAAIDATGNLRVLDNTGDVQYGWVLDDTGKFTGEQRYDATTRTYAETMFGVDLNNDGTIGTGNSTSTLQTIKSNGSVTLLTDLSTGIAFIQNGTDPAIEITRADSYWSGAVPLSRGGSTLISAAIDDTGNLRVLDASGDNQYGWILDDTGRFTGEERYDTATRTAAEDLFGVDLNNDGTIGTTEPAVSAYELTGFNQGEFRSTIAFSHRATVDPIVAPGNVNFPHMHDFFANPTTGADSTVASLMEATNSAAIPANNISTYWAPSLIDEGNDGLGGDRRYIDPLPTSIAYYSVLRPNEPNQLVNMPTGLKMITGSAMPMERQSRAQVFWNYIGESASYDHIPLGDEWRDLPLQAVIIFPEYWDGEQLDAPDHKSHLAYGNGSGTGPDGHRLLIPQLQLQIHYGRISNNLHLVSSDYMTLPDQNSELGQRLQRGSRQDLSFRNGEEGFAPGWSLHADHIHLPWLETAPTGEQVDGFARREADVLRLPLFAGPDGNSARPIPTGITQPYSVDEATLPVLGTPGDDVVVGTSGNDRLEGLEGDDSLIGAGGADLLVGSDGADRFVLESIADSTFTNPDEIIGFGAGDRLDLRALNLSPTSIRIEQQGPSVWFVRADGTNLDVHIRTDNLTAEQIILE